MWSIYIYNVLYCTLHYSTFYNLLGFFFISFIFMLFISLKSIFLIFKKTLINNFIKNYIFKFKNLLKDREVDWRIKIEKRIVR